MAEEAKDDTCVTASAKGEDEQLPDDQKCLIINYYAKRIPTYAALMEEYEKDKAKDRTSQSKFPPVEQWQPSKLMLNTLEQSLLAGPSLTLVSIKRVRMKMPKTRRWIVYTAAKYETSLRVASSYVCVNITCIEPQFGRIIDLYSHTFGGCNSFISKIQLYQAAKYDAELKMWHVPQQATDKIAYCFLDQISVPLIIANDSENSFIWFLNYKTILF